MVTKHRLAKKESDLACETEAPSSRKNQASPFRSRQTRQPSPHTIWIMSLGSSTPRVSRLSHQNLLWRIPSPAMETKGVSTKLVTAQGSPHPVLSPPTSNPKPVQVFPGGDRAALRPLAPKGTALAASIPTEEHPPLAPFSPKTAEKQLSTSLMSPVPRGGKPNRREGKLKERREARSGAGEWGLAMGPAGLTPHQAIFCLPSSSSHRHGNPSARAAPLQLRFPPHGGFGGLFPPFFNLFSP